MAHWLKKVQDEAFVSLQIDGLSRATRFDEAQALIDEFERHHPPTYAVYSQYRLSDDNMSHLLSPHLHLQWLCCPVLAMP